MNISISYAFLLLNHCWPQLFQLDAESKLTKCQFTLHLRCVSKASINREWDNLSIVTRLGNRAKSTRFLNFIGGKLKMWWKASQKIPLISTNNTNQQPAPAACCLCVPAFLHLGSPKRIKPSCNNYIGQLSFIFHLWENGVIFSVSDEEPLLRRVVTCIFFIHTLPQLSLNSFMR